MRPFAIVLTVALLCACAKREKGPVLASSAGQPVYALRYADVLGASARAVGDAQEQVHKLTAGFRPRLEELKKPDWDVVRAVVDAADTSGKSVDFAAVEGDDDSFRAFWGEVRGTVDGKVAGGAQHAAKQAACTSDCTGLDVGGPAVFALNDAMDKELQRRLRASNDAFVAIDRHRAALGAQNASALERLADDVARASYIAHVAIVVARDRVKGLLAERSAVQATLDRFLRDEQAYQAQPGRTEAEKKASNERILEAGRRKADVEAAAAQAQAAAKASDDAVATTAKEYDDAVGALRDEIDRRKRGG